MSERTCTACRWWVIEPHFWANDGAQMGKCRRNVPKLVEDKHQRLHSGFPHMREDGFCGQWRDRNPVVAVPEVTADA